MFSPLTNNMEERLELMNNSMSKEIALKELQKCESLRDFYYYSKKVKNGVIAKMQVYVLKNHSIVPLEIWNGSNFQITPHLGKDELNFGKKDTFTPRFKNSKTLIKAEKRRYDKSTKITSISFTLDEIDGDFSVDFNDGAWSFLWEDDIVTYYYTVKNHVEYLELREKRNSLRDEFEKTTDVLKGGKIKKEIEQLDIELTRYEKV